MCIVSAIWSRQCFFETLINCTNSIINTCNNYGVKEILKPEQAEIDNRRDQLSFSNGDESIVEFQNCIVFINCVYIIWLAQMQPILMKTGLI